MSDDLSRSFKAVEKLKNAKHFEEIAEATEDVSSKCHRFKKPPSNKFDNNFHYERYFHGSNGCCPWSWHSNEPEGVDEGLDDKEKYFSGRKWESKHFSADFYFSNKYGSCCDEGGSWDGWWQTFSRKFYYPWREASDPNKGLIYHCYRFRQEITNRSMYYLKDSHPYVDARPPIIIDSFRDDLKELKTRYWYENIEPPDNSGGARYRELKWETTKIRSATLDIGFLSNEFEVKETPGAVVESPLDKENWDAVSYYVESMLLGNGGSTAQTTRNNGSTHCGYLFYNDPACNADWNNGVHNGVFIPLAYRGWLPKYDRVVLESHGIFAGGMPRLRPYFGWFEREIRKARVRYRRLADMQRTLHPGSRNINWFDCHAYTLEVAIKWEANLIALLDKAKWKYFVQKERHNGIMPGEKQYFPLNDFGMIGAKEPMMGWSNDDPQKQLNARNDILDRIIKSNLAIGKDDE